MRSIKHLLPFLLTKAFRLSMLTTAFKQPQRALGSLKGSGSRLGNHFRWVLADELAVQVERRAQAQFGTAVSGARSKKQKTKPAKSAAPLLSVDPAKLQIAPASFVDKDGSALKQLDFCEVGHQGHGVAFCSAQQIAPFLQAPQSLSVDPLALVCTSEIPAEASGGAPVTSVSFPAIYMPTQEAILLRGSLLQLGDESVQLAARDITDVEPLETITCRLSLYRDECGLEWSEFCNAPVRALQQHIPGLLLCKDSACAQDCGRFHAAVDETVDRLFLDIWGRQFVKVDGGKASQADSAAFHCLVRVPGSALSHLHKLNVAGFYCEPRAAGGNGPHPGFAVIWLPGSDRAKALHSLRTCSQAVSLARLGTKYGLRVREADEQKVLIFEAYRPGQEFVQVKVTSHFKLFPLPFGFQRKNVAQALRNWQWCAKPLQPVKGNAQGCAWLVGSSCDPPLPALPLGDQYVLVNKVRDSASSSAPASVTASQKTRRSILYDDGEGPSTQAEVDPWSHGRDPWALARAPPGLPPPPTAKVASASTADTKLSSSGPR